METVEILKVLESIDSTLFGMYIALCCALPFIIFGSMK